MFFPFRPRGAEPRPVPVIAAVLLLVVALGFVVLRVGDVRRPAQKPRVDATTTSPSARSPGAQPSCADLASEVKRMHVVPSHDVLVPASTTLRAATGAFRIRAGSDVHVRRAPGKPRVWQLLLARASPRTLALDQLTVLHRSVCAPSTLALREAVAIKDGGAIAADERVQITGAERIADRRWYTIEYLGRSYTVAADELDAVAEGVAVELDDPVLDVYVTCKSLATFDGVALAPPVRFQLLGSVHAGGEDTNADDVIRLRIYDPQPERVLDAVQADAERAICRSGTTLRRRAK